MHASLFLLTCLVGPAQSRDLAFHAAADRKDLFSFETGALKGAFLATDQWEGIVSCVDLKTGKEMTRGNNALGLFHLYRLLSRNKRWGDTIWSMPKRVELREDGSLLIRWAPQEDRPFEITAAYVWSAPDTLDLHVSLRLTAPTAAPQTEMFIGSYLNEEMLPRMYVRPARAPVGAKGEFVAVKGTPLLLGTYCMFPRDLQAAQLIYDGRWLQGKNPVDWSVSRYMGAPLGLQHDFKADRDVLLMADPEACFAVAMSYHLDPPDGVASHRSTYFSLFGGDLSPDQAVSGRLRAVIGGPFNAEQALARYEAFLRDIGGAATRAAADKP